jgi:VanZ family protein
VAAMNAYIAPHLVTYLFILSIILIVIGCLLPAHWLPPLPNDKYLHFISYAILSMFTALIAVDMRELLIWQAGLIFAGILIECFQHFIPGRRFCWRDILANTGGVCLIGLGSIFFYI